jgi:hypothetical protein
MLLEQFFHLLLAKISAAMLSDQLIKDGGYREGNYVNEVE